MIRMVRQKYDIPMVAIGGITIDNIGVLKENGIQCFALINSIFTSTDIISTIKQFKLKISKMNEQIKNYLNNQKYFIPGGVNSPVRAFGSVGGTPIFFKSWNG